MEEVFSMTNKEIDRIPVIAEVIEGNVNQVCAAKKLKVSERQVRRLITKFKKDGKQSLISKKSNKPSNRCLPSELKSKTINLVESHYVDFGPTLANEYLRREHDIFISTEILRLWMIEKKLWISKTSHKKLHPPGLRRRAFGELIQIDGSHHDWFEGRSPPCTLMVFINDATSAITALHFSPTETLEAYYCSLEKHLKTYGILLSFYGDRCSVLKPRQPQDVKDGTQFQKALRELDCRLILALSPQAKGRVERANRTLQDRLVKELRLRGISTIDEANLMIEEYRKRYNQLFPKNRMNKWMFIGLWKGSP